MKPDWKDAPEWARFLAQDSDGEWFWYENEPRPQHGHSGTWDNHLGGKVHNATVVWFPWEKTLERRP